MSLLHVDVLIIGNGLGATAAAMQLAPCGASIAMMPGAGKSRSTAVDGGVVSPDVLRRAFGPTENAPISVVDSLSVFRRSELEEWALGQLDRRVRLITDIEERSVLPHDSGSLTMYSAANDPVVQARMVVLTEGANPKIGISARLRPDFEPSDMLHFGRTLMTGTGIREYATGSWRTSWGMPAWYQVVPQADGTVIVTASARIENIMRAGRNAKEALADLLSSPLAEELGLVGAFGDLAMELVPLRPASGLGQFARGNLLISPDAMGAIDAREMSRWDDTIATGAELGGMICREWPNPIEWDEIGASMMRVFRTPRKPYHDDRKTGFIEEGPGPQSGLLSRLLGRA